MNALYTISVVLSSVCVRVCSVLCLSIAVGYLHVGHPVHDVSHLLQEALKVAVGVEALASRRQQLLQVLPEPQHVVAPRQDAPHLVVALCLQLAGHRLHGRHALAVRADVGLDGLVLPRRSLNSAQVAAKVVL